MFRYETTIWVSGTEVVNKCSMWCSMLESGLKVSSKEIELETYTVDDYKSYKINFINRTGCVSRVEDFKGYNRSDRCTIEYDYLTTDFI